MFHVEHCTGDIVCTIDEIQERKMKQRKRVGKSRRARAAKGRARKKRVPYLPPELAALYKPLKMPVTLRLDADILAWFKKQGRGYQTRINQALQKLMTDDRKRSGQ
jgi:uncharacterized protein (DUF4415 family)